MATVTGSRDVTAANFLSNADNNIFKKSNISIYYLLTKLVTVFALLCIRKSATRILKSSMQTKKWSF